MIYFVSKLFTYLFLLPGIFILGMFLASFFAKKFKKLLLFLASLFWFLSTDFAPYLLLKPLEYKSFPKSKDLATAVVVLGGGEVNGAKNLPLSSSCTKRVLYALMISNRKNLPLIFSGVEGASAKESIEQIDRAFSLGFRYSKDLKPKTFYIESKSKDTYENAKYIYQFFKSKKERRSIYLVTSAYHMPRAYMLFKNFEFDISVAKTDFKTAKLKVDLWSFFPQMANFKNSYLAIHEYFGILSLLIRL
ncbi:MAG TPA: YdcF family protein [Campylobacterales bacterium]|nr:YdcF family protein [Campylobacterales bacterium]